MPAYFGVRQAELIASINDGLALLETYSPGAECQKRIDALRAVDPATGQSKLGAIAAAADDVALATAVRASGVNWVFARMGDVLRFHAAQDTDGLGAAVHQRLVAWNATGGAMTMEYNKIDEECDSWLALQRAAKIPAAPDTKAKLENYAAAVSQQTDAVKNAVKAMVKMISGAAVGADNDRLKRSFLSLSLHERHIVTNVFQALTKDDAAPALQAASPLARYGVVIPDLTEKKINWTDATVKEIRTKVEAALMPFYETDEVQMTGIGLVYDDRNRPGTGIVFLSTRRAAEAVAAALAEMLVAHSGGAKVAPPAPPQASPKKGFNL